MSEQVALITGASSGIGEATARTLCAAGYRLVLTARTAAKLDRLAGELGNAVAVPAEVTDPGLPDRLLGAALDRFGRADVLVNNAGLMQVGPADAVDIETVVAMVRVNVEAVFRLSYAFVRHAKPLGRGFLVNVSSISGLKTVPTHAAYNGTKFAVEAFTDALRVELAGTGVRAATVAPGAVATNLYDGWDETAKGYIFSGGALRPDDIARCVKFLLDQPAGVTVARVLAVPAAQPL